MDAPVAGISISKAALRVQLSKCARFQAFTGVNEAASLLKIATDAWPFPLDENGNIKEAYSPQDLASIRPFAMIFSDARRGYSLRAVGAPTACVEAGTLNIHLEKAIAETLLKTPSEVNRQWDNDLGQIARELMDLKTTDGMLQIDNEIAVRGPFFSTEEEQPGQGNFCYALMTVTWGGGQ